MGSWALGRSRARVAILPGSIAEVASGGTLAGLALGAPELGQYAALGLMTAGVAAVLALGAWRYRGIQV